MATVRIPKEMRPQEGRVALIPRDVRYLTEVGHTVLVENSAGVLSGYADQKYIDAGAQIVSPAEIWVPDTFILKVKELQASEFDRVMPGTVIMLFPHFGGDQTQRKFFEAGQARKIFAIPHESLCINGASPVLAAMSRCAGEIAVHIACENLRTDRGGPGILPSDATALVLGMGHVGSRTIEILAPMVHTVHVHDVNFDEMPSCQNVLPHDARSETITEFIQQVEIIISAAVNKWGAPKLITREMRALMRPNTVIIDVPIDEGGNCEFSHPTEKVEILPGTPPILYCGISNLPGRTPRSASHRFSAAVLPFVETALTLIDHGIRPTSPQTILNAMSQQMKKPICI